MLSALQKSLHLKTTPSWIEAFDISNLKEKFAVGASVAFRNGKPYKQCYRRYRIKRIKGQNDVAMIKQIIERRLAKLKKTGNKPDLLLIDGGKGQLSAALKAIKKLDIEIAVFALAKRFNELYNKSGKIVTISSFSPELTLLKRIRDEAHRFAITYHRKIRGKTITNSELDAVTGIGTKRKKKLLKYFGSLEAIKKASYQDLLRVPNIGKKSAQVIYETFHKS